MCLVCVMNDSVRCIRWILILALSKYRPDAGGKRGKGKKGKGGGKGGGKSRRGEKAEPEAVPEGEEGGGEENVSGEAIKLDYAQSFFALFNPPNLSVGCRVWLEIELLLACFCDCLILCERIGSHVCIYPIFRETCEYMCF